MKKRIIGFALSAMLLALSVSTEAQQMKVPRIGFLSGSGDPANPPDSLNAFRQGLRELGYIEGKNIILELRYAAGNRDLIPGLVAELVQLKVDVLATGNLTAIRAAMRATKTIPILMVTHADPVATGLVDSLASPGGNVTGFTTLSRDLSGKRLELLKEILPKLSRVGILWDESNEGSAIGFKEYEAVARAFKITLQSLAIRGANPDLPGAFQAAVKGRAGALIPIRSAVILRYPKRIVELAIKNRLPSMHDASNDVEAGGLVSYSANDADQWRRAATYVDKILKGTKPADLPVEQPMKFELIINLKTAKQLGVTIPQWTLMKADKVIR
ncbi:MAG: ABC transporter substrate-binding protein [Candidatus Binatia bacterium]|nr:ABC transporter substrate-binding protein [Candidatus Binatia bacterium]